MTGKIVLVGLVSLLVAREVKAPEAEGEMILAGINEGDAQGITGVASKGRRLVDDTNITSVSATHEHLGLGITDFNPWRHFHTGLHTQLFGVLATRHKVTKFWEL